MFSLETSQIKSANKGASKPKKDTTEKKAPIIRFIRRDGTVLDTLEGVVVPINEKTETAYRLLAGID